MSRSKIVGNVRLPKVGIIGYIKYAPFAKKFLFKHKNDSIPRCVADTYERCELLVHLLCDRYEIELIH